MDGGVSFSEGFVLIDHLPVTSQAVAGAKERRNPQSLYMPPGTHLVVPGTQKTANAVLYLVQAPSPQTPLK